MVTSSVRAKFPLSYQALQRIKAEEYERFFNQIEHYHLYINHLGEINWMKMADAVTQHEFFLFEGTALQRLKTKLSRKKDPNLTKLSLAERELRLQIRVYLEKKHLGRLSSETEPMIPQEWHHELNEEEIEHIPLILEALENSSWKKPVYSFLIVVLLIAASLITYFFLKEKDATGQLFVTINVSGGRVFMDNHTILGYSGTRIQNIPVGKHKISVRKSGYVAIPISQEIEIIADSMINLGFQLHPLESEFLGYLKIEANQIDSDIFIDDHFLGKLYEQPVISLNSGQHRVVVKKRGYVTVPAQRIINITPGDTSILRLDQILLSVNGSGKTPKINLTSLGNLEVTANASGARIYLNGRDTGKETDYIFSNLKLGSYRVTVEKKGFNSDPGERTLRLTSSDPTKEAYFKLTQEFEKISIKTDQPQAEIFVDGQLKGNGSFTGQIEIGEHDIAFGNVAGYNAPKPKKINIKARLPQSINVKYFPRMKIVAEVTRNGNIRTEECTILTGYTMSNRGFSPSDKGGPEVLFEKSIEDYFWKLGFAFPLRNPKGNDAVKMDFKLPYNLDYNQKFILRIEAAASKSSYPLVISKKFDVSIKFNNTILSYYYQPKTFEDLNGFETQEWDITKDIRQGPNSLEISTTSSNNTYFYLKKIEIFN